MVGLPSRAAMCAECLKALFDSGHAMARASALLSLHAAKGPSFRPKKKENNKKRNRQKLLDERLEMS